MQCTHAVQVRTQANTHIHIHICRWWCLDRTAQAAPIKSDKAAQTPPTAPTLDQLMSPPIGVEVLARGIKLGHTWAEMSCSSSRSRSGSMHIPTSPSWNSLVMVHLRGRLCPAWACLSNNSSSSSSSSSTRCRRYSPLSGYISSQKR